MVVSNFKMVFNILKILISAFYMKMFLKDSLLKEKQKAQIRNINITSSSPLLLIDMQLVYRITKHKIFSMILSAKDYASLTFLKRSKIELRVHSNMTEGDKLPSGHVIKYLTKDVENRLRKTFFMYKDGAIRANPGGWILPSNFTKFSHLLYNYKLEKSDIIVATYPKSGTTWTQEIVWNLVHNPNLDNPQANINIDTRFPNVDADMFLATTGSPDINQDSYESILYKLLFPGTNKSEGIFVKMSEFLPRPRMLKSHLPLSFLPQNTLDTCKVCYVARDPRDVMTSLYHYVRLQKLWGFAGELDDFVDCVIRDEVPFAPYWSHLKLAWDQRNHPNMCFIFYEDLKSDIHGQLKRVDAFLGTNRNDQQIQNIVNHTSFSQMKERLSNEPTSNDGKFFNQEVAAKEGGFFRKGETGDWKNRFTPNQINKLHTWMAKNLEQFGNDFKYKI